MLVCLPVTGEYNKNCLFVPAGQNAGARNLKFTSEENEMKLDITISTCPEKNSFTIH
jgi:hypothetical protein